MAFVLEDSCGDLQAYHNELVSKVSRLEEENLKLKKEKVGDLSVLHHHLVYHMNLTLIIPCFFLNLV